MPRRRRARHFVASFKVHSELYVARQKHPSAILRVKVRMLERQRTDTFEILGRAEAGAKLDALDTSHIRRKGGSAKRVPPSTTTAFG